MKISSRLKAFRKFKKWEKEYVADCLGLSNESYYDLEAGSREMDEALAKKLSELYHAPIELFLIDEPHSLFRAEVLYYNCTIQSFGGCSSGYVNHQYNDRGITEILFSKKEEIKSLKEQVKYLQSQNTELLQLIKAKNTPPTC